MEPKHSMTSYAIANVLALTLLALTGAAAAAKWIGVGIFASGFILHGIYLLQRRAGISDRRETPNHRKHLDWIVRAQWLGIGAIGFAIGWLVNAQSLDPLDGVGLVLDVAVVGIVIGAAAIFVSALVDWYIILPKVSGISCPAPCESGGNERWAAVSAIWLFHRGVTPLIIIGVILGMPAYIAAVSDDPKAQAAAFVIAGLIAGYILTQQNEAIALLRYAFNPPKHVGDIVWIEYDDDPTTEIVRRRPAYVVDLAREGAKYKWLRDGGYSADEFLRKGEGVFIDLEDLRKARLVPGLAPPCASGCRKINWYCHNNPLAHHQAAGD